MEVNAIGIHVDVTEDTAMLSEGQRVFHQQKRGKTFGRGEILEINHAKHSALVKWDTHRVNEKWRHGLDHSWVSLKTLRPEGLMTHSS